MACPYRKSQQAGFPDWYARSKVRQVVYHATTKDFHAFDTSLSDLGAHFGTLDQVHHVVNNRLSGLDGVCIIPVWLALQNPLRLKDTGSFHAHGIAVQLEKKGLLPRGEGKRIEKEVDKDWRLAKHYDPILKKIIEDAGYDGVVYKNDHEGAGDSYIAFHPCQIKSVFAIAFDKNTSDMTGRSLFIPKTKKSQHEINLDLPKLI